MKIRLFKNRNNQLFAYECVAGMWHLSVTFANGGERHIGRYDRNGKHHEIAARMVVFMQKAVSEQFVHDALCNMNPFGEKNDSESYPISLFPKDGCDAVAILCSEDAHGTVRGGNLVIENFSKWRAEREFVLLGEVRDFDWDRDVAYVHGVMHVSRPEVAVSE